MADQLWLMTHIREDLFNASALILSLTSVNRRISQTAQCSSITKQELSYRRLTFTCRTSKQSRRHQNAEHRQVGFQTVVCNATDATYAMYAHEKCRKMQCTQRIELIGCFVLCACMRCVFRFLIASQAVGPLRCVHCVACVARRVYVCTTTWTPYVGLRKVGFQAAVHNATDVMHLVM